MFRRTAPVAPPAANQAAVAAPGNARLLYVVIFEHPGRHGRVIPLTQESGQDGFSFALMIASADGSGLPIVYRLKRSAVAGRVGYAERKRDIINDWTIIQSKSPLLKLRIGTVRNEAKLIRLIERVEVPQLEDPFSELPTSQWVEIVWIELQHDQAAGGGEDWAIEKVTDLTWSDIVHAGLFWTRAADGQGRFREIVGQPRRPIMTWDMVLHRLVVP